MRANKKVRQRAAARASSLAIFTKGAAGAKAGRFRQVEKRKTETRNFRVAGFLARKTKRKFGAVLIRTNGAPQWARSLLSIIAVAT